MRNTWESCCLNNLRDDMEAEGGAEGGTEGASL